MALCKYHLPYDEVDRLAMRSLNEAHTLIAGATGSGKSTLLDTILTALTTHHCNQKAYAIIDLKRVSLMRWKDYPHCLAYETDYEGAVNLIKRFDATMERRYKELEKKKLKDWQSGHFYLIIDEAACLLDKYSTTAQQRHEIMGLLTKIGRLGRAAGIHLIYATQQADRDTIPATIQANCNCKMGLHCNSAIESRQIIGYKGCESLPRYGECMLSINGEAPQRWKVNLTSDETMEYIRVWWTKKENMKGYPIEEV